MLELLIMIVRGLALALSGRRELVLENVALRQQLAGKIVAPAFIC